MYRLTWKQFWALESILARRDNMADNLVALSALASSSANVVLWIVAAVLLVLFLWRQRSRKAKEQNPRH